MIQPRPITPLITFEKALGSANLSEEEQELIDYIRYVGTFNQLSLAQSLRLNSKPPVLSKICLICRKIGGQMPEHFTNVIEWSKAVSDDGVHWEGDLICSNAWNIDGERLSPEAGTTLYHTFVIHKELFQGLS